MNSGFWQLVCDPNIHFMRYALLAGVLSSVAFGVVGSYVVVRRVSFLAGAIAHSVLGGIGAALYARAVLGWGWCDPLLGALAAALLSAIAVWLVTIKAKEREDSVIGAIWAVGMGVGLLFISRTPGYVDPMSYLFGDVLLINEQQLWLVAGLDVAVLAVGLGFYHRFRALAFDEEFCAVRGINARLYMLILLCLVALTIVMLVSVVGIVLVIALLTLPASAAGRSSRSLLRMMVGATLIGLVSMPAGLYLSYGWNLPAGPMIVLVVSAFYGLSWAKFRR